ncbi:MAG: hypothetical protein Q8868_00980 [Bacteroidota bacterium]|nr:hypothetical protein [Bacteroidota bacterium]
MVLKTSNKTKIAPIEPICRKIVYTSREEAEAAIAHIKEIRRVREIHAYRCNICGFWHLTSKSGK